MKPRELLGKPPDDLDKGYESFLTPLPNFAGARGLKDSLKEIKAKRPDLYRAFFPKIYCGTDRFYDWRTARLVSILGHLAAQTDKDYVAGYQAYLNLISFSLQWAEYKTPTFFISADLLRAVQASGLPKDFDFTDLRLPFPSMLFVFPKGSRTLTLNGQAVQYIGLSHKNGVISTPLGEVQGEANKLIVTTAFYPTSFIGCGFKMASMNEIVTMDTSQYIEESHNPDHGAKADENETLLTHDALKLALGCVLAMEARPELIERERQLSVIRKKNATQSLVNALTLPA